MSVLRVGAGESRARLDLYAGQPQRERIVSYGPFIGDSKQDIARLFAEYQSGTFPRLSELKKQQVLTVAPLRGGKVDYTPGVTLTVCKGANCATPRPPRGVIATGSRRTRHRESA